MTERITLFGVRTPLIGDYEETCLRLGLTVAAAVQVDGNRHRLMDAATLIRLEDLTEAHRTAPFIAPAFVPARRRELVRMAEDAGFNARAALVDPTAVVASTSRIAPGTYVNAMTVIASASRIGAHVFINRACNIGHHVLIGDFASLGPGVTIPSSVRVGEGAVIGAGAVLLPGVVIGTGAIVSAGTRVHADVPDGHLAIGAGPTVKPIRGDSRILIFPDQE
jgi:UDP-3-O-[3-hydroxymyristoyl] glucosamine N-acyltransferase